MDKVKSRPFYFAVTYRNATTDELMVNRCYSRGREALKTQAFLKAAGVKDPRILRISTVAILDITPGSEDK